MQWSELNRDNRDTESLWKEVAPLLEEAMGQLRQADQDAVLLRFFAGKNLGEVGQALGVSDDTAQKRVNRALERMRTYFARRGVVMPVALLGSTLAAHTVQAAPIHLASTLAASVTSAPGLGLATTLKFFQAMAVAKLKATGLGAVAAAIIIISGTMALLPTPAGPGLSTNGNSNRSARRIGVGWAAQCRDADADARPAALSQFSVRLIG